MLNRSGDQECPICEGKHILVEHHIEGRKIHNPNHPSNLCYICDNCHRLVHEGKVVLEGHFKTTHGTELFWHQADKESFTGEKAETYIIPRA